MRHRAVYGGFAVPELLSCLLAPCDFALVWTRFVSGGLKAGVWKVNTLRVSRRVARQVLLPRYASLEVARARLGAK
jgi:hypothetical protein